MNSNETCTAMTNRVRHQIQKSWEARQELARKLADGTAQPDDFAKTLSAVVQAEPWKQALEYQQHNRCGILLAAKRVAERTVFRFGSREISLQGKSSALEEQVIREGFEIFSKTVRAMLAEIDN